MKTAFAAAMSLTTAVVLAQPVLGQVDDTKLGQVHFETSCNPQAQKRFDRALICFLTAPEITALLAAPDRATWIGRRDRTLLLVALQTGLRVSELTGLACRDVHLGSGRPRMLPWQRT